MITRIPIGQSLQGHSYMHRLDPRTKLVALMVYVLCLFFAQTSVSLFLAILIFFGMVALAQVPLSYLLKSLKWVWIFLCITLIFHLLFTRGGAIWLSWGIVRIDEQGVYTGLILVIRIMLLVLASSLFSLTTKPFELTLGLERLLSPLKKLRVPVQELSLMVSIAIRFIPILLQELQKLMQAQRARGARFDGTLRDRARAYMSTIIPLFLSALKRAEELALAMEARGYQLGAPRTHFRTLAIKGTDIIYLGTMLFLSLLLLVL